MRKGILNQSFSVANFRKIIEKENRRGNYLEAEFFPDVEEKSKQIHSLRQEMISLKEGKSKYSESEYEKKETEITNRLKDLYKEKKQLLDEQLESISLKINSRSFSFGIKEVDVGTPEKAFVAERNGATFFALKQVQYNINRLYKVRQSNRYHIICQIRELLGDKFPKYILRTDISSFYESIPRNHLLKKLSNEPLLTPLSKRIIRKILFEYGNITGSDVGLPRGIGISAYLAELYMRDIDRIIRDYPSVIYYARYVDDIFIIYCPPPNTGPKNFVHTFIEELKKLELKRSREKTQFEKIDPDKESSIQYLGYKFSICSGSVNLGMTDKKLKRYKDRINRTFEAYHKKSGMPEKSEQKARSLLEKRIRFLTGNTRLVNNKKNIVSGIFFSNSLLTQLNDLDCLDKCLTDRINSLNNSRLKKRLEQYSFKKGFETKKYHKFSAHELYKIVQVWKYAS